MSKFEKILDSFAYSKFPALVLSLVMVTSTGLIVSSYINAYSIDTSSAFDAASAQVILVLNQKSEASERRILELEKKIEAIISAPRSAISDEAFKSVFSNRVSVLEDKTRLIETSVVDNPEKAMSVTLLRKDLDNLTTDIQSDIGNRNREIERLYSSNSTTQSSMWALIASLFGLNIWSAFRSSRVSPIEASKTIPTP